MIEYSNRRPSGSSRAYFMRLAIESRDACLELEDKLAGIRAQKTRRGMTAREAALLRAREVESISALDVCRNNLRFAVQAVDRLKGIAKQRAARTIEL